MEDRLLQEIDKVKSDKVLIDLSLETEKEIFAKNMLGSMGEDMKMNVNKKIEPVRIKIPFRYRLKRFFKNLMSIFVVQD